MFILLLMIVLATLNKDAYVALVALVLLFLPPINWSVAGVLIWTSRQDPTVRSLADAADNALTWAVNSTAAAIVGVLVLAQAMGLLQHQTGSVVTVMLGFIVVTSSLPAFRFLRTWREVWMPMILRGEHDPSPADGHTHHAGVADDSGSVPVQVDDPGASTGAPVD